MKLNELLKNNKNTLSFEVFPPKTDSAFDTVKTATEQIATLKPAYISVTYGAGGGTSKYTLDIAKNIKEKYNVPTLAHLTCVSSNKETVKNRIKDMIDAGIENVLALRGDVPKELMDSDRSEWSYHHAIDLIYELKDSGADFCIGGACYPEIHPESPNRQEDIKHLKEKADAGCSFFTTQMFFDNNIFYNFKYLVREVGVDIPIIAGIMPITNISQLERSIKLSGSYVPKRFLDMVDKCGDDPIKMKEAGILYATEQILDLFSNGVRNVHVYTMNKPDVAEIIQKNVIEMIK